MKRTPVENFLADADDKWGAWGVADGRDEILRSYVYPAATDAPGRGASLCVYGAWLWVQPGVWEQARLSAHLLGV